MPSRVYEVLGPDREQLARDLAEDRISRLSLWVRDARHFGLERDAVFVVLEGAEPVLQSADARILAYGRVPPDADKILGWVRFEDEAAATGVGAVFGPAEVQAAPPRPPPRPWERLWRWLKA